MSGSRQSASILVFSGYVFSLQWRRNGREGVSNHQPHHCLLNRLFRRRSKKTPKLRVTSLCAGNSPVTGEFPAQMTRHAEKVSIWWRHHITAMMLYVCRVVKRGWCLNVERRCMGVRPCCGNLQCVQLNGNIVGIFVKWWYINQSTLNLTVSSRFN